jgi:phosphomannomutase
VTPSLDRVRTESDLDRVIKAYDVRGVVPDDLDADLARLVGAAFVHMTGATAVAVGRDMRPSGPDLVAAFTDGATGQGADVIDIGLCSTDGLYFASGRLDIPGAMFTASHNPAQYNGIKLCRAGAAPVGRDSGLDQIRRMALEGVPAHEGPRGTVSQRDMLSDYVAYLHELVDLSGIRPLKVVVDAGNGMGGHTVPAILTGVPVEVDALYFELDGSFPNHEANPIEPENLRDIQARVTHIGADLGLALDGDADRCFVVDENGRAVDPSTLTALIAVRELRRAPGSAIIHNLITSRSVPEIVREHGGVPVRTRVGHSFIKETMAQTDAVFGGEHSGHFYFRDFWRADSGMLAALHVLAALGETPEGTTLSSLLAEYERWARSGEINSRVDDQQATVAAVRDHYAEQDGVTIDDLDGMTVDAQDWWFNLRASNTEPLLRLNVEARTPELMVSTRDGVLALIRGGVVS